MSLVKIYWENGCLKRSLSFQDGIRHGLDQMWNEEGVLIDEGEYNKGLPVGVHRRWDRKGNLIEEISHAPSFAKESKNIEPEVFALPEIDASFIPGNGFPFLIERYPMLGLLAPRWVPSPFLFEFVSSFSFESLDALYVYGLGCGGPYLQLKSWLSEKKTRKLIFLEDEEGPFASFLRTIHSETLLQDPQVHLEWIGKETQDLTSIASAFPFRQIEMVMTPSKSKNRFDFLKEEILRKTALSHAYYLDRLHGNYLFYNFTQNLRHLPSSFYANGLKKAFQGVPAIVCGAGPSLQKDIPLLKTLSNRALIIAGGSTLAALSSQGVPIHFGMVIDPNPEETKRMKNSFAFDTPILYSTRVHPGIFQTCNGPFGYMRSGLGHTLEAWGEESLGLTGPMIGEDLPQESLSVTTMCTAWAEFLGCTTILFSGLDLAYTNQKRYAKGVKLDGEEALSPLGRSIVDKEIFRKDRKGRPIQTAVKWIMESASLSEYARKYKHIRFINTTEGGLPIRNIPYMPLSKAAEKYLIHTYGLKEQIQEKITKSPMPEGTREVLSAKQKEMRESLLRVIKHLEVLSLKKKGASALAELDLQEEMATRLLFHDISEILEKTAPPQEKWSRFLEIVKQYCFDYTP